MLGEKTDVLIVGAGPAGLAAALALKRLGVTNLKVVDREDEPGGIPRLCHHTGFGWRDLRGIYSGPDYARRYLRQAEAAGIEILTATTITGWQSSGVLTFSSPRGLGYIESRAVLLATGCRERPRSARLVPGSRPQGVFTTGSLQRFAYQNRLPVGRRAVIVGAELVSLSALLTLGHAGVTTAMLVTELPRHQIYFPYLPAKWLFVNLLNRVPILSRARVNRILGAERVEAVEIRHLDSGETEKVECDTVVFSGDWIPENELARHGKLTIDPGTGGPRIDAAYRTSARGIFAAGNLLRGAETADTSALEGRRAAQAICEFLQGNRWPEQALPIEVETPILWIVPNVVTSPAHKPAFGYFTFRVSEFYDSATVQVTQGSRLLYSKKFDRLRPNDSHRLSADWLTRFDLDGPPPQVRLSLPA